MQTNCTTSFPGDAESAALLSQLWRDADIHPEWPCLTSQAAELLRTAGYDITAEKLESWARSGQCGTVAIRSGKFAWSPQAVYLAGALCEASRRWIPMHTAHVHKMTAVELAEQHASQMGQSVFTDADSVDFRSLIGVISGPHGDDRDFRSMLCQAVLTKLRKAGIE